MQHTMELVVDNQSVHSAFADLTAIVLLMVDSAFGTSWSAIVVTLDDMPLVAKGATVTIPVAGILLAILATVAAIVGPRLLRRMIAAWSNYRDRQSTIDICEEIIDDWRSLRRQSRDYRSDIRQLPAPTVAATVATVAATIENPCSPTDSQLSKGRADNPSPTVATVARRQSKPTVAATVERTVARNSDNRLSATDATVGEYTKQRLVTRHGYETGATAIYQDFCAWCVEKGVLVMSQRRFGDILSDLGYEKQTPRSHNRKTVFYQNVVIRPEGSKDVEFDVIEGGRQ